MELLKMKEYNYNKQLKMNNNNNYINEQTKKKYNMKEKKKKMKKDFSEKIIKMNNLFTIEKKNLDEELITLKQKREYNLNLKNFMKIK